MVMKPNLSLIGVNHNIWCMKLNSFVNTNSDAPPVLSHRDCELGKWLYSSGLSKYGHITDLKALEQNHQQLHSLAQKVVDLKSSGNINQARQELFVLQDYSDKVIDLLGKLKNKIND